MSYVLRGLIIVFLVVIALIPLHSPGTVDVLSWLAWIDAIEKYGLISAYANVEFVYPPMTWILLRGVAFSAHLLNIEMFLAIKWSLVVFLLLTSTVFLLWTRNLFLTAFLHLSLVLSSVALGYLDIWFAPSLLLALWALKEKKILLFTVFFTISCLIKPQPLIIAPFLLVYIVGQKDIVHWKATLLSLLRDVILPAGLLTSIIVLPFGQPVVTAFQYSLNHAVLSGNALNYNWLLTYFLHLTQPDRFGPIDGLGGVVGYIEITDWSITQWPITVLPRILFALFYLGTLLAFLRRQKSFDNFLRFAIAGYLSYFTFNIGVHENHLFLAMLLAFTIYGLDTRDRYTTLILALMANINLFLFYGVTGEYPYQRLIGIDLSVPLALFNVLFFLAFWVITCWQKDGEPKKRMPAIATDQATAG